MSARRWPTACRPEALFSVGIGAYLFWRSRRKYLIIVTGDGLTIDRRRGDVYLLVDAQLGLWVHMGLALHLHRSTRRRCRSSPPG
jgi:hypothetical protein